MAEKTLSAMQKNDDDSVETLLASAWVNLARGGEHAQEAVYTLQELIDKHGASLLLLNALAAANMRLGNFVEADRVLIDASSKGQNDPDTLVNMVACARHLQKPEELIARYISQLSASAPNHEWVVARRNVDNAFDRAQASLV